jgi:Flp pilus assembly protein TadD
LKNEPDHDRKRKHRVRETEAHPAATVLLLLILGVVAATLIAHWPALSAQALNFDDHQYLTENPLVRNPGFASAGRFLQEVTKPSTVEGYYQPLTMISLMLDYAAGGRPENLRQFHRTSLALHVANVILITVLLYMLFGQPWVAAMVGLIFGVHPVTVETIPWVGERKTLLAAFFALWCLIAYVRYARRPNWGLYAACLVLYLLALLAKPTSTPLPVVLLLLDFWPLNRLSWRTVLEKVPHLVLAAVFSVITMVSQANTARFDLPGTYAPGHIPLILGHNIIFYLLKFAWPANLSSHYPFPQPLDFSDSMVLAGMIGTCILIPALAISLRWTRAPLTGWLIFFVAILPTMGILGFTIVIAADKYMYLPAVGLLLILAWVLEKAWMAGDGERRKRHRATVLVMVVLAAGLLTGATHRYLGRWSTSEELLNYMIGLAPRSPVLYNNRATVLTNKGDYDGAVRDCTKAVELKPDYAEAYCNRGNTLDRAGSYEQAIQDCTRAIQIQPKYAQAYGNRGIALAHLGRVNDAIRDFSSALERDPRLAIIYSNRGLCYTQLGDSRSGNGDPAQTRLRRGLQQSWQRPLRCRESRSGN